ncbi:MAG: branched-chain amino acid ABC transporter permease [Candidatus Symbiobacter sp.]|nr:branched-chain amino acid ABC transporter permease [Candidatus Symbiobacter sp.]
MERFPSNPNLPSPQRGNLSNLSRFVQESRPTWPWLGTVFALILLFFVIPDFIASMRPEKQGLIYYQFTQIALLSIAAAGVWLTFYIGRINIGQGALCLVGAYVSAIVQVKLDVSYWLTIPLAGIFCVLVGIVIGWPILRLRGVYFAMITLILTEVAKLVVLNFPIVTNGARGITNIPLPEAVTLFGFTILPEFTADNNRMYFYFLSMFVMVLTFIALFRLVHSRIGRLCKSLQQNEELASSLGVNLVLLRLIPFCISCFMGGVAGALAAGVQHNVGPSIFTVQDSVNYMLYCFMGGLGNLFGPLVGTVILRMGWNYLTAAGDYQLLFYAIALIILMLIIPNGVMSLSPVRIYQRVVGWLGNRRPTLNTVPHNRKS